MPPAPSWESAASDSVWLATVTSGVSNFDVAASKRWYDGGGVALV